MQWTRKVTLWICYLTRGSAARPWLARVKFPWEGGSVGLRQPGHVALHVTVEMQNLKDKPVLGQVWSGDGSCQE